ncbi:MAG TPA: GntR family transcriptional regulator [Streptosporangiaceae bacterium]|nr:GntR family transcriptional regulator [Streptosporangiaceae bacterium]
MTDWVYEELKSAIVDLRLAPGDPLREATLADQLGVSKTPIREALTRLEQEGLVETTSFKGAVVTGYSRQDLLEIYELRELLENAAARTAAESMADVDRDRLDRICRESRKLKKNHDAAGLAALISAFDDVLFEQVRNSRIRALIENLRAHLTRIGHLTAEIPGRIEASVDEHEKIVQAIAARDPEQAEQQMREHIRSVRDDQLRALGGAAGEP